VGLPAFITIDFAKQLLHGTEQQGRTSALTHRAHRNARLLLHGGEEGRGWTVVRAEDTGTMAATVAEDQVGLVVFGACIPRCSGPRQKTKVLGIGATGPIVWRGTSDERRGSCKGNNAGSDGGSPGWC